MPPIRTPRPAESRKSTASRSTTLTLPGLDNHPDRVAQRSRILDVEVSRGGDHGVITEPFRI